jgi:hypothetical protein
MASAMASASLCRVRAETCKTIELFPNFGGWKRPEDVVETTGFVFTAVADEAPLLRVATAGVSCASGVLGDDLP